MDCLQRALRTNEKFLWLQEGWGLISKEISAWYGLQLTRWQFESLFLPSAQLHLCALQAREHVIS